MGALTGTRERGDMTRTCEVRRRQLDIFCSIDPVSGTPTCAALNDNSGCLTMAHIPIFTVLEEDNARSSRPLLVLRVPVNRQCLLIDTTVTSTRHTRVHKGAMEAVRAGGS
jgi:hypothetical protein